ncbi:MAG: ABC transporter ATP-binding protein [Syntrophales bacterium]|jgi:branched-chain amino acid transport system ATP-binding protein|nr:ABC transporter ATP-binding protein [Syntrophales bacterium]MDY0045304.1 ABC transporter ATP-binding protein [Syntrophales bacterium]
MLEVKNLSASYGTLSVLHEVSFNVYPDEIVTLLGSNGAGKSTILNAVQGIMKPTSGAVLFQGKDITGLPPHKIVEEGVIHIPEGHRVFPYLTVKENLYLGAYAGQSWKERNDSAEWVMDLFPILKMRSNQQARLLSGGEQQMLNIGRGLMSHPRFIMVDEPSVGLAPVIVDSLFESLETLREKGITILLPEQNALRALQLADRGYVIQDGKIIMEGKSEGLMKSDLVKKAYLGR